VALFLIGLSLTVHGRSRLVLVVPGVVVAIACVGWAALIDARGVTSVSERAVQAAAEGLRLQGAGDFEGAIDAFDEAIRDSPDFAAAYARRADARFLQGSEQIGQQGFLSITSEEALEEALEDLDDALARGADTDVVSVADAGFFRFLAGDFDRSAELSTQALELNDQLAQVWFNLGVAELARDEEDAAARAYREGRRLLEDVPNPGTRSAVLAGARTDLSVLRTLLDDDDLDDVLNGIEAVEGDLAAFEAQFLDVPCDAEPCPEPGEGAGDAEVQDAEFSRTGGFVFASYTAAGVDPGTPLTNVWYIRTDEDRPFEQTAIPIEVVRAGEGGTVTTATLASAQPACPVAGEYLVRVYAGEELVGEVDASIDPSPIGEDFTSVVDPVEGFDACVAAGFDVQRADVSELDAFTGFNGPEFSYGLNVTPGVLGEGFDADEFLEAILTGTLQVDAEDLVPIDLQGRDLEGNFVSMPGLAGASVVDGIGVMSAVAFGPDGASRNVTVTGSDDLDLLFEAVGLIEFTGLPAE
jgi:tetratricopeptide (TPR) repeat protein